MKIMRHLECPVSGCDWSGTQFRGHPGFVSAHDEFRHHWGDHKPEPIAVTEGRICQRCWCLVSTTESHRCPVKMASRLAEVAQVYKANFASAPTRAVAEAFSISQRSASNWIERCRNAGLLGPTTPGKKSI